MLSEIREKNPFPVSLLPGDTVFFSTIFYCVLREFCPRGRERTKYAIVHSRAKEILLLLPFVVPSVTSGTHSTETRTEAPPKRRRNETKRPTRDGPLVRHTTTTTTTKTKAGFVLSFRLGTLPAGFLFLFLFLPVSVRTWMRHNNNSSRSSSRGRIIGCGWTLALLIAVAFIPDTVVVTAAAAGAATAAGGSDDSGE